MDSDVKAQFTGYSIKLACKPDPAESSRSYAQIYTDTNAEQPQEMYCNIDVTANLESYGL